MGISSAKVHCCAQFMLFVPFPYERIQLFTNAFSQISFFSTNSSCITVNAICRTK